MIKSVTLVALASLALAGCGNKVTGPPTVGGASSSQNAQEAAHGGQVGGPGNPATQPKQTPSGPTTN